MKKFYALALILFSLQGFSQYTSHGIGRWTLGVNLGASWQTANINSDLFDLGYGATLEYAVYQKYDRFFAFSLRGRFLRGRTTGYNKLRHNRLISNDNINGVNDSSFNYSTGPLYQNNRTTYNEFSLEAMLKWNKLYQNTGIIFYLYAGGGFTQYKVETDQLDAFGNMYDYSFINGGSSTTVDELQLMQDGEFETELSHTDFNSMVFTPSFGVGFGVRLAPGVDLAWEHKVSLPQTDLWEGQEYATSDPSIVKDIYHYSSLGLMFTIVGDYEGTTYTPPVEPTGPVTPITPVTTKPKRPTITITKPTNTNFIAPNCKVEILAKIENVIDQKNIEFYHNGTKVASNRYFFTTPNFKSTIQLAPGRNDFKIVAKNDGLTDTKTFNLSCNNINSITICHKNANGSSSEMTIPESEWSKHAAHGDSKGACPEKQITICHNIPGKPGETETIQIPESQWNLHKSHGDYQGGCSQKTMISICHNNKIISIDEKDWPIHAAHGDVKGDCPPPVNMITICHIPETGNKRTTMTIPENEWVVHQAHGDTKGVCPNVEPYIDICHKNNNGTKTTMSIPAFRWNQHFAHGDSKGKCPETNFMICHTNPSNGQKQEMYITESMWPAHAAHGDIRGKCPEPVVMITICLNKQEMTIDEKQWPNYAAQGATKGKCPEPVKMITICFNKNEMSITESQWASWQARGATLGPCPKEDPMITICHYPPGNNNNPQTIQIPSSAWPAHAAHGDSKGACPAPEKYIDICHKDGQSKINLSIKESEWALHAAHGDTKGKCPVVEPKITICHYPPGNNGNPQTIQIPASAWPAHAAHGDSKGACPTPVKYIDICHHEPSEISALGYNLVDMRIKESDWAQHAAHGDTKGKCKANPPGGGNPGNGGNNDPKIKICHYPPGNTGNPQTIEIPQSAWAAHAAHGDSQGPCPAPEKYIDICHKDGINMVNMSIKESEWAQHAAHGDTKGNCPVIEKKMTICHYPPGNTSNPQTIEIPVSAWSAHAAHGDNKGACPAPVKYIDICHKSGNTKVNMSIKETDWAQHAAHGDTKGKCPVDKKIKICHYPPGNTSNPQTIEIPESAWSAHAAHGDSKGECQSSNPPEGGNPGGGNNKIIICHYPPGNTGNPQTIEIPASAWPAHAAHGDTKGACANTNPPGGGNPGGGNNDPKITICHYPPGNSSNPQTIEIPASAWPAHAAHGDSKGACPTGGNNGGGNGGGNSGGNMKITICHYPPGNNKNPQTIEIPVSAWPAHAAHGDTKGSCGSNSKVAPPKQKTPPKKTTPRQMITPRKKTPPKTTTPSKTVTPKKKVAPEKKTKPEKKEDEKEKTAPKEVVTPKRKTLKRGNAAGNTGG